jgi:hypothetical protein
MFISAEAAFTSVSFNVNPAMEIDMNAAPRRFFESSKYLVRRRGSSTCVYQRNDAVQPQSGLGQSLMAPGRVFRRLAAITSA